MGVFGSEGQAVRTGFNRELPPHLKRWFTPTFVFEMVSLFDSVQFVEAEVLFWERG